MNNIKKKKLIKNQLLYFIFSYNIFKKKISGHILVN